jgi:hypothetical protein
VENWSDNVFSQWPELDRPGMEKLLADLGFHRRAAFQRLVNPDEVVIKERDSQAPMEQLGLLGRGAGQQACEGSGLFRRSFTKEVVEILSEVANGTINDPANLSLHFIDIAFFLRQTHPAELDRLSDFMVNLTRAEHVTHPVTCTLVAHVDRAHHAYLLPD